jgi:hypothetical protein
MSVVKTDRHLKNGLSLQKKKALHPVEFCHYKNNAQMAT